MGVFLSGGYGRLFGVTGASRPRTVSARDTKHIDAMAALARVHHQIVAQSRPRNPSASE